MTGIPFSVLAEDFRLRDLEAHVRHLADQHGWDSDLLMRVNLVLEELCLNVRSYGEVDGRRIDIWFQCCPVHLVIQFSDGGCAFDPIADAPPPDLTSPLRDRQIGGLGLFLVRQFVDEVVYCRTDGCNSLRLCFFRRPVDDAV